MKKMVLGMLLLSSSAAVNAADSVDSNGWVAGVGYATLSDKDDGVSISLGGLVGSLGYRIQSKGNFSLSPELRIGTGISDDSESYLGVDVKIELDRFIALSLRGQFDFNSGLYVFGAPSYANAKFSLSASQGGQSASSSDDSWEFGLGLGAGYKFSDTASAELSFEQFDETDVMSLGLKFSL